MSRQHESIADALARAADEIDAALAQARSAHEAYSDLPRGWDSVSEEIGLRRTRIGFYTAGLLVDSLREEAEKARRRAPDLTVSGSRLPARPAGDDPEVVRRWWAGLTDEAREELITQDARFVGSADGLPVRVRHRANLAVLDAEIERRTALAADALESDGEAPAPAESRTRQGAEGPREADPLGATAREERDLRGLLKLRALLQPAPEDDSWLEDRTRQALEKVTTPQDERFLYLLDASDYPVKTAIVLGDLEVADHVVLHVPGATTTVDLRLFREAQWLSNLRSEAGRFVGAERVAVVDWIGYQAPYDIAVRRPLGDSGLPLLLPGEAADARYARQARPAFLRCARGLRTIAVPGARLVASGHSYGASVIGFALSADTDTGAPPPDSASSASSEPSSEPSSETSATAMPPTSTPSSYAASAPGDARVFDAVMVAGCPGLFATSTDELGLPADSVFAAAAPGDVVALLGIFGGPTLQVRGVRSLATRARPVTYPGGPRTLLLPVFGHEAYYNPGTTTLHGFAAIAAGALDQVRSSLRTARAQGSHPVSDDRGEASPQQHHNATPDPASVS